MLVIISNIHINIKLYLVAPVGFEPTTLSLEVSCSIQLSYGATSLILPQGAFMVK